MGGVGASGELGGREGMKVLICSDLQQNKHTICWHIFSKLDYVLNIFEAFNDDKQISFEG